MHSSIGSLLQLVMVMVSKVTMAVAETMAAAVKMVAIVMNSFLFVFQNVSLPVSMLLNQQQYQQYEWNCCRVVGRKTAQYGHSCWSQLTALGSLPVNTSQSISHISVSSR